MKNKATVARLDGADILYLTINEKGLTNFEPVSSDHKGIVWMHHDQAIKVRDFYNALAEANGKPGWCVTVVDVPTITLAEWEAQKGYFDAMNDMDRLPQ